MNTITNYWIGLLDNKTFIHFIFAWLDTIFPIYVFVICSKFKFMDLGKELLNNRRMLLLVALETVVLIPLIAAGAVKLISIPLVLGGIMLIASTAPGDPFDLVETHGKKGGLLLSSALMLFLVLIMPLSVPLWMAIFSKWFPLHLSVSPSGIFHAVAPKVLAPLAVGLILSQTLPKLADKLSIILHKYFEISAILITIYFLPLALAKILTFGLNGAIAMFIVTTLTLFLGYYTAKGFKFSRKDSISVALVVSLGNMAAVLFIAHNCYPKLDMIDFIVTVFGWIVLRWIFIWIWYFVMKFIIAKKGEVIS